MIGILSFAAVVLTGAGQSPSVDLYLEGGNTASKPNNADAVLKQEVKKHTASHDSFYVLTGQGGLTDSASLWAYEFQKVGDHGVRATSRVSGIDPRMFAKYGTYQTFGMRYSDGTASDITLRDLPSYLAHPDPKVQRIIFSDRSAEDTVAALRISGLTDRALCICCEGKPSANVLIIPAAGVMTHYRVTKSDSGLEAKLVETLGKAQ